jgi:hypothetical protein
MHKIVEKNGLFELDLTVYGISLVENNNWFKGNSFVKYSFPFNLKLNENLIQVFGYFLDDNNTFTENKFDVTHYLGNQKSLATLEIEGIEGKEMEATLSYGLDEFTNWQTSLQELDLLNITVTNIYDHAKNVLFANDKTIGYQFPQIHTLKYERFNEETNTIEPINDTWSTFLGIINNYRHSELNENGISSDIVNAFYENTHTELDFANRNIIQPAVYFRYILKVGFAMNGLTLKGDAITSSLFDKLMLFADVDYFKQTSAFKSVVIIEHPNYDYIEDNGTYGMQYIYNDIISLKASTKYKITGEISFFRNNLDSNSFGRVRYKSAVLANVLGPDTGTFVKTEVLIELSTNDDDVGQYLILEASDRVRPYIGNGKVFNLIIEEIIGGTDYNPEIIENRNSVNLKKAVPNINFGKFVTLCEDWFHMEKKIEGSDIYMNFIENQINYNNAVDLSNFEVLKPIKKPNKQQAYALKFKDYEALPIFKKNQVFVDKNGVDFSPETIPEDAEVIELDVIPLPNFSRNLIKTAYMFNSLGDSQMYAFMYNDMTHPVIGLNLTIDNSEITLQSIYEDYYKKWFNFLMNSINYNWIFKMYLEKITSIDKKVFAYGRYHVIKTIDKTQLSEDLFEVEIETKTLK